MSDWAPELDLAQRLVRAAGTLAAQMRADGLTRDFKTSISDVVTAADRAAEALVVEGIRAAFPRDAIVGEEGAFHEGTSGRTWIIDPVDGTYNFISGLTWWCSALALVEGDDVVFGAIHHPYEEVTYLGGPELGATRNGEPIHAVPDARLAQSCVTTYLHPPDFASPAGAAYIRLVGEAATQRMLGSGSLDLMAVAQGHLQLYTQHTVQDWDRLPGEAIVRGVGGEARQVEAAGRLWTVIGAPSAVAEAASVLQQG